jgi:hypothetical protein
MPREYKSQQTTVADESSRKRNNKVKGSKEGQVPASKYKNE